MVKTAARRKAPAKTVKRRRMKQASNRGLDASATAYARLLADPCNAPLAHPVYPGGDAGFLFRAESFITLGAGATDTSGILHWTPGYINSTGTEMLFTATTGGSTAGTLAAFSSAPGKAFLTAQSKAARCIAACVKVTFPGSESARGGRLHYGQTNAGLIDSGNSVTPDAVALSLQHFNRVPPQTTELIWKPNIADTEMNDPSEAASPLLRDRKAALTIAWAGLPVATGLTFHFTAVYEWTPLPGSGVGHNSLGKNRTRNSLDDVLDTLIGSGFGFVRHAAGMVGGAFANGVVNTVSTMFGSMPAQSRTRRSVTFY